MKLLSITLCTILMLFSFNSSACKSVDESFSKYGVGLSSQKDILEAVYCNLEKVYIGTSACN